MKKIALALALVASPVSAQDINTEDFVEANILSIFYHELGHALIDVMALPVFGQEEDAADTASILLIDSTFDEETAVSIAYDAALGFAAEDAANGGDVIWWSEHGADLQRFYNLVCLFYGANPDDREDFAEEMELPQERADGCPDEYDLAIGSWGPVFDDLSSGKHEGKLGFSGDTETLTGRVIESEVAALNKEISLPVAVGVTVEACGEANAFYDLDAREIIMCLEFEGHLRDLADTL